MSRESTTSKELLERAIEAIDTKGEAGLRVRDLLEAVGVTAPVMYRAFGSREGIVVAAQTERYRRALNLPEDNFLDRLDQCTTKDELRAHVEAVLDIVLSDERAANRRTRMNVTGSAITRPGLLASIIATEDQMVARLAVYFEQFQEKGLIRADLDARSWLHWYLAVVNTRSNVEIREGTVDAAAFDAYTRSAILTTLFGES